jgi:hypothetical protein
VKTPGWLAPGRNSVLFIAGFLGIAALQQFGLAVPRSGEVVKKWRHLGEKGGLYSVVFVGSSRVAHHFIPEQFDASVRGSGIDCRSFNFGVGGMFPPESFYVLRSWLESTSTKPRWVIIDMMEFRPVAPGNEESERAVAWHDWHHTGLALRMASARDGRSSWGTPGYHARLFATRTVGLGRWQDWVQRAGKFGDWKFEKLTDTGFEPMEERRMSATERADFQSSVAQLRTSDKQVEMPAPYRRELLSLVEFVRSHGAEPVFVVAPIAQGDLRFRDWPPAGVQQFSYDNPAKYPQLYRDEERYDSGHLLESGAKKFTAIFAEEFAGWVDGKK